MSLDARLQSVWYGPAWRSLPLWPLALFVVSIGLLLPLLIWPSERKTLAAFFIPALVLLALGTIFLYDTLSGDWASWTFAWILIPTSVGSGLYLAARFGQWGAAAQKVGVWMALCGLALFALVPFSRLVHAFTVPLHYLFRPYIVYRSRDVVPQHSQTVKGRGWDPIGTRDNEKTRR